MMDKINDLLTVRIVDAISYVHEHILPILTDVEYITREGASAGILTTIDPRAIIIHTQPKSTDTRLIGKGVTFDSGGYSLKQDSQDMFADKAGAILALCFGLKYNIPVSVGFMSNMIGRNTEYVPGSIHKIGRKKVYVADTDAEGRLLLAELLTQSKQAQHCVCVATLTGHASYFLGEGNGGLLHSDNKSLCSKLCVEEHFRLYPAPRYKEYNKVTRIQGAIANCDNAVPDSMYSYAFLRQFHKSVELIDMAAEMLTSRKNYTGWGEAELCAVLGIRTKR